MYNQVAKILGPCQSMLGHGHCVSMETREVASSNISNYHSMLYCNSISAVRLAKILLCRNCWMLQAAKRICRTRSGSRGRSLFGIIQGDQVPSNVTHHVVVYCYPNINFNFQLLAQIVGVAEIPLALVVRHRGFSRAQTNQTPTPATRGLLVKYSASTCRMWSSERGITPFSFKVTN